MPKEVKLIDLNEKEKALLVTVDLFKDRVSGLKAQDEADELRALAKTSGVEVMEEAVCHYDKPSAGFFIGSGKVEELAGSITRQKIDVAMFSVDLSPTQARNLEDEFGCKVLDRTQVILDIFSQHARSPEGGTQVELAQLEYLLPRLSGKGVMLSRMGGGIGTRGPGEQKLELDRRRIRSRIAKLKRDLSKMRSQRVLVRKKRKEDAVPLVSLVGYTNAGKTTLLNSLINEHQLADDSLFTTLDPLNRTLVLPNRQRVVISDTVGFLHNLPHHLIEAFKSTLEDVREADLLIHVLDVAHPLRYVYYQSVETVLGELGCLDKPVITALNKVDKLEDKSWLERYKIDFKGAVVISALVKEGLGELLSCVSEKIPAMPRQAALSIPLDKMSLVDLLYREAKIEKIRYTSKFVMIHALVAEPLLKRLSEYIKK